MPDLPAYADVVAAAERIAGVAHRTPVLRSRLLDEQVGAQVWLKVESLQRMGAFKFRGAFNALSRLSAEQRTVGVIAYSSGNHAQAVSLAAQLLGVPATIVMPLDAPASKVAATVAYGGQIVTYDRYTEDNEQIARDLARERGLTLVPPYDHPDVIAGQGTAAKELFEEVGELDAVFAPLGGGGLLSGTILSAGALSPRCQVFGVEPLAGNDGQQSLQRGAIVDIDTPETIADGAQTKHLGRYTFEVIRRGVTDILTATDAELVAEMRFFASRMKLYVEPTGCLGLAGLRGAAEQLRGQRLGVIVSGGNVDLDRFAALIGGA
jgi:threonine dehydratase